MIQRLLCLVSIEFDIRTAEREKMKLAFLRKLIEEIDENDWSKNVLITLIGDAGTRTFAVEAGGSQESLRRRLQKNLQDKLKTAGLKLPLYPTPQLMNVLVRMGSIDFDPTSDPVQQVLVDGVAVPSRNQSVAGTLAATVGLPKGAVRNTRIWLNKTISEYRNGYINSFVFFTSASEIIRATPVIWDYPVCIPFKRVKQLRYINSLNQFLHRLGMY